MNELNKSKQILENSGDKQIYSMNSFRNLYMERNKINNEIKINNNNLTSRIIFEVNNKLSEKSRTTSKNKMIANKIISAASSEKSKLNNK